MRIIMLAIMMLVMCSCKREEVGGVSDLTINIKLPGVESGLMKSTNYDNFYDEYIKTYKLVPKQYSMVLMHKLSGREYILSGRWDKPTNIGVEKGLYSIEGICYPRTKLKNAQYNTYNDTVYLRFSCEIEITEDIQTVNISCTYDCFLILADSSIIDRCTVYREIKENGCYTYSTNEIIRHGAYYPIFCNTYELKERFTFYGKNNQVLTFTPTNKFYVGMYYYLKNVNGVLQIPKMVNG